MVPSPNAFSRVLSNLVGNAIKYASRARSLRESEVVTATMVRAFCAGAAFSQHLEASAMWVFAVADWVWPLCNS